MKKMDFTRAELGELLAEYAKAALDHRQASRDGKYKIANRAHDTLLVVVRELRRRGPDAQRALLRLLSDERIEVRGWAAAHVLEFDPDRAVKVLEAIAAGPSSLEEFSAKMVLQQWRTGTLGSP